MKLNSCHLGRYERIRPWPFHGMVSLTVLICLAIFAVLVPCELAISQTTERVYSSQETSDTAAIAQGRRSELDALTQQSLGALSQDIFMCEYRLGGPQRCAALAEKLAIHRKKFEDFLTELQNQIESSRSQPEQAILGLDDKLKPILDTARLRLAEIKRLNAIAILRSGNDKASATRARILLVEAASDALRVSEGLTGNSEFAIQCKLSASLAINEMDPERAESLLAGIMRTDQASRQRNIHAAFELCWSAARRQNFDKAEKYLTEFSRLCLQHTATQANAPKDSKNLSLAISQAVLTENLFYLRAITAGNSPEKTQHYRMKANEALEKLFRDYPQSHPLLAGIITEYLSARTNHKRQTSATPATPATPTSPASIYAQGLMELKNGKLTKAAALLDGGGVDSSPYLAAESLWQLALANHRAASAASGDNKDELFGKAGEFYYRFARMRPDDSRFEDAMTNSLAAADTLASSRDTNDSATDTLVQQLEFYLATSKDSESVAEKALRLAQLQYRRGQRAIAIKRLDSIASASEFWLEAASLKLQLMAEEAIAKDNRNEAEKLVGQLSALAADLRKRVTQDTPPQNRIKIINIAEGMELKVAWFLSVHLGQHEKALAICEKIIPERTVNTPPDIQVNAQLIRIGCLLSLDRADQAADIFATDRRSMLIATRESFAAADNICRMFDRQLRIAIASGAETEKIKAIALSMRKTAEILNLDEMKSLRMASSQMESHCLAMLGASICESEGPKRAAGIISGYTDRPEADIQMLKARINWLNAKWRDAVEGYYKIIAATELGKSDQEDIDWWLAQGLLARCVMDNSRDLPIERKRLRIRLRQLQLRDPSFGGFQTIFIPMTEQLASGR